jgi:hypothetical protein
MAASHAWMRRMGWERVDPRPWTKCGARWTHRSGWRLSHCGHPTANWPWALYDPQGEMVCSGVLGGHPRDCGYAWSDLSSAATWVASLEVR